MFGSKLRSWMEAVRPRKKQHRKEKQKNITISSGPKVVGNLERNDKTAHNNYKENDREATQSNPSSGYAQCQSSSSGVSNCGRSRYSANNLSSPESAYSTGYSTDGTSPGAPPEYLLNSSKHSERYPNDSILSSSRIPNSPRSKKEMCTTSVQVVQNHMNGHRTPILKYQQNREVEDSNVKPVPSRNVEILSGPVSPALGITSPRPRNRIRTNPWLPGGVPSPSSVKHEIKATVMVSPHMKESPRPRRYVSPVINRRRSLSSSSCSSLSEGSLNLEPLRPTSASDEEDCTLNEMMGKYDESYVYEKETDILSDSDPTDCETDIDTGQDGGDEDDTLEGELDFIDNGSHLEYEPRLDHNTGHCIYYNYDVQRKRSSRRRTTRKGNKQSTEKKRRSSSSKKRHIKQCEKEKIVITHLNGSKSAGATPLSVRRASHRPVSKLAFDECLKRRSNSISFYRDHINTIDKRDKEADLKYKELIVEAEQILRTMKTNGLSPRRIPGPANKRVELLRTTECSKPDVFIKNKPGIIEDSMATNTFYSKNPSNNYNCPRFSPKKNHITNFIISNSPVVVRKEWESPKMKSPLRTRNKNEENHLKKGILHREKKEVIRMSPRNRRKVSNKFQLVGSSSDSEEGERRSNTALGCPQSEPVRRKVYFGRTNNAHKPNSSGKTVAFNLSKESNENIQRKVYSTSSSENLRQQVLLNTIVNLKRNLEDQSASLKQVYNSSHNIYI